MRKEPAVAGGEPELGLCRPRIDSAGVLWEWWEGKRKRTSDGDAGGPGQRSEVERFECGHIIT